MQLILHNSIILLSISSIIAFELNEIAKTQDAQLKSHLLAHSRMYIYDVERLFNFRLPISNEQIKILKGATQEYSDWQPVLEKIENFNIDSDNQKLCFKQIKTFIQNNMANIQSTSDTAMDRRKRQASDFTIFKLNKIYAGVSRKVTVDEYLDGIRYYFNTILPEKRATPGNKFEKLLDKLQVENKRKSLTPANLMVKQLILLIIRHEYVPINENNLKDSNELLNFKLTNLKNSYVRSINVQSKLINDNYISYILGWLSARNRDSQITIYHNQKEDYKRFLGTTSTTSTSSTTSTTMRNGKRKNTVENVSDKKLRMENELSLELSQNTLEHELPNENLEEMETTTPSTLATDTSSISTTESTTLTDLISDSTTMGTTSVQTRFIRQVGNQLQEVTDPPNKKDGNNDLAKQQCEEKFRQLQNNLPIIYKVKERKMEIQECDNTDNELGDFLTLLANQQPLETVKQLLASLMSVISSIQQENNRIKNQGSQFYFQDEDYVVNYTEKDNIAKLSYRKRTLIKIIDSLPFGKTIFKRLKLPTMHVFEDNQICTILDKILFNEYPYFMCMKKVEAKSFKNVEICAADSSRV